MLIAVLSGLLATAGPVSDLHFAALTDTAPPQALAGDASPPIDPRAAAALQRMGRYLQSQRFLSLRARASADHVISSGQKVQLDFSMAIWIRQPDGLRLDVSSDRGLPRFSQFYFDGKTFTAFGPTSGSYAKMAIPANLRELSHKLSDAHGLKLPLVDLFTWAGGAEHLSLLTSAANIGPATIGGWPCDQYAFRQSGLDWQVWIQRGPQPLPRRIVLRSTDDPAQPQQSVEMTWLPEEPPAPTTFVFEPPAGSREVAMPLADEPLADRP